MISPSKKIEAVNKTRHLDAEDLIKGIKNIGHQINLGSSTPLITDLRINQTFKDKAKKEETNITDLVLSALWLLREDI